MAKLTLQQTPLLSRVYSRAFSKYAIARKNCHGDEFWRKAQSSETAESG